MVAYAVSVNVVFLGGAEFDPPPPLGTIEDPLRQADDPGGGAGTGDAHVDRASGARAGLEMRVHEAKTGRTTVSKATSAERGGSFTAARSGSAASLVVEWCPDQPVMTVRISDSSLPKAVGLIGDGKDLARSRTNCSSCSGVGVIHDEIDANRRPVERRRAPVERLWILVHDEEPQPVDTSRRRRARSALLGSNASGLATMARSGG
jgi:hypothetical protein